MQATSLPNPPSILSQYPRQLDNNYLNIPSIVTSPSIPTSTSDTFIFNFQEPLSSPISPNQATSAPVTPTSSVTPGFSSQPPRRNNNNNNNSHNSNSKGNNQNGNTATDGKSNGSKSEYFLLDNS